MSDAENLGTEPKMTERQALGFIVRLMQGSTLRALTPGRWAAFLEDMREYLGVEGKGPVDTALRDAEADREPVLKGIEEIRQLVKAVVSRERSPQMPYQGGYLIVDATGTGKAPFALHGQDF